MNNRLIFDLGFHLGDDTDFYLNKGFNVVALEAHPKSIAIAKERFAEAIRTNRLRLVEATLAEIESEMFCDFYLPPQGVRRGSIKKELAERNGGPAKAVQAKVSSITNLFDVWGVPHYIKCNLLGANDVAVYQLLNDFRRPSFLSFSGLTISSLAFLYGCGYSEYQIVDRAWNEKTELPSPSREGHYSLAKLGRKMQGLFGWELEQNNWRVFEEAYRQYAAWRELKQKNKRLLSGSLVIHARYPVANSTGSNIWS